MEQRNRICVAGVGAVGGLLAALLGQKYECTLSVIARGARAEAFRKNGIILHSEYYGEHACHPKNIVDSGEKIEIQDYIFICVKNYSLATIAELLRPCVDSHTVLIPVMNGIEAGDRLRELFPDSIVCDALIYTNTGSNADYSASQIGSYTYVCLGSRLKGERYQKSAEELYQLLQDTKLDVRYSEDIWSEIWQKYVLNCAFNTVTARYIITSGEIRKNETMKSDLYALLTEAYKVGIQEGVCLPDDLVEQKYQFMMEKQAKDATSSLKRDVEAHRPTELDAFLGALLRKAAKNQIAVPVAERYYREISAML